MKLHSWGHTYVSPFSGVQSRDEENWGCQSTNTSSSLKYWKRKLAFPSHRVTQNQYSASDLPLFHLHSYLLLKYIFYYFANHQIQSSFGHVSLHRFDRYTYLLYQTYPLLPPWSHFWQPPWLLKYWNTIEKNWFSPPTPEPCTSSCKMDKLLCHAPLAWRTRPNFAGQLLC